MGKAVTIVTNNPMTYNKYKDDAKIGVEYLENGSYYDVVITTRNRIQSGWRLLTHPQASNLKPTESPNQQM